MVWAGNTLTIAPSAGVAGELSSATSGFLDIGRKRYLNKHECHYFDGFSDRLFLTDSVATGTNASNAMDASATCQPNAHSRTLVSGVVSSIDLLGNRYLNLHECHYHFFFADRIFLTGSGFSGTTASNDVATHLACLPNAGAHALLPAESNQLDVDMGGQRYLNLHQCVMLSGADHIGVLATSENGTNASDSEDTLAQCPSQSGAHNLVAGTASALDLLDPTRGRGFVEFHVTASDTPTDALHTVTLDGANFTGQADDGAIRATTNQLLMDGFECGTTERWAATVIR